MGPNTRKLIGSVFLLFVAATVTYAFSARTGPILPPTEQHLQGSLVLDAERAGGHIIAVGERGQIFIGDAAAESWKAVTSPTAATLTSVFFVDATRGWAVGHDSVVIRTEDGGLSWRQVHSAPDEQKPLLDVWFADASQGFAIGAYGTFLETADGGATWRSRKILDDDKHLNAVARAAYGTLYIAGETGTLLRSGDGGKNWEKLPAPYQGSFFGALALKDGGILVFGMRGKAFRSEDRGASWQAVDTGTLSSLLGGRVLGEGTITLVGQDGLLLASRDGGRSFRAQRLTGNRTHSSLLATAGGEWLAFGEGGLTQVRPQADAQSAKP